MKKSVEIKLTTIIRQPDMDEQVLKLQSHGTMTEKNQRRYLQYDEKQDELNIRTTVKISEEEVVIMRSGDLQMRLPFLLHKEQTGNMTNAQGSFMLTTTAHELEVSDSHFKVRYDLVMGADLVGEYEMVLKFTEAKR